MIDSFDTSTPSIVARNAQQLRYTRACAPHTTAPHTTAPHTKKSRMSNGVAPGTMV